MLNVLKGKMLVGNVIRILQQNNFPCNISTFLNINIQIVLIKYPRYVELVCLKLWIKREYTRRFV